MSHKKHREQVRLLKNYKTGPSFRACDHKDCWKPKSGPSMTVPEVRGHVCWMFKDGRCGCGRPMKRGLGYSFEVKEEADDKVIRATA